MSKTVKERLHRQNAGQKTEFKKNQKNNFFHVQQVIVLKWAGTWMPWTSLCWSRWLVQCPVPGPERKMQLIVYWLFGNMSPRVQLSNKLTTELWKIIGRWIQDKCRETDEQNSFNHHSCAPLHEETFLTTATSDTRCNVPPTPLQHTAYVKLKARGPHPSHGTITFSPRDSTFQS